MRWGVALLAGLWLVLQCAVLVGSHPLWAFWDADAPSLETAAEDPAPWSSDAENEPDESDEEEKDPVLTLSVTAACHALRLHCPLGTCAGDSAERPGHGLPLGRPPRRG